MVPSGLFGWLVSCDCLGCSEVVSPGGVNFIEQTISSVFSGSLVWLSVFGCGFSACLALWLSSWLHLLTLFVGNRKV